MWKDGRKPPKPLARFVMFQNHTSGCPGEISASYFSNMSDTLLLCWHALYRSVWSVCKLFGHQLLSGCWTLVWQWTAQLCVTCQIADVCTRCLYSCAIKYRYMMVVFVKNLLHTSTRVYRCWWGMNLELFYAQSFLIKLDLPTITECLFTKSALSCTAHRNVLNIL